MLQECKKRTTFLLGKVVLIFFIYLKRKLELHHSAHASHSGSAHWHFRFIFLLFYNYTFSSQEHTSDRSCIFQSYTSNLSRVYYTGSVQVFVNIQTSVVTKVTLAFTYFLNNYRTFFTSVSNDLTKWFFDSTFDDFNTGLFSSALSPFISSITSIARM